MFLMNMTYLGLFCVSLFFTCLETDVSGRYVGKHGVVVFWDIWSYEFGL